MTNHLENHKVKFPPIAWLALILIAIVTYSVFSPSLNCGFTNWDDDHYVTDNPIVVNNDVQWSQIFQQPVLGNYHPITMLSLAFNYQLSGLNPKSFHAWNVWIHVANTILIFFFIFFLTHRGANHQRSALLMASIVSLFFGIHPLHVESVTWISERKDVLYVFFFISGLLAYLKYIESKLRVRTLWLTITYALFILSCLSKAMAVTFPLFLLLIDYWLGRPLTFGKNINKAPFFLISLIFGILAYKIQIAMGAVQTYGTVFNPIQIIDFAAYAPVMYIVKTFVPFNLSAFYSIPIKNSSEAMPLFFQLCPLLFLGIAILLFRFKNNKNIVFGYMFYFLSIVVVIHFTSIGRNIMADRFCYLSSVGLLFLVAIFINSIWYGNPKWGFLKYQSIGVLAIAALLFSIQTYERTQVWKDSETLWTDAIKKDPTRCEDCYNSRGVYYHASANNLTKSLEDYQMALNINPAFSNAYNNRGLIYFAQGKNELALADFTKAVELNGPPNPAMYWNRGRLNFKLGNDSLALLDFNHAIETKANFYRAYYDRGKLFFKNNKPDLALNNFNTALTINPLYAEAYCDRGIIYFNAGKKDSALSDYNRALELDTLYTSAFYNRGLLFSNLGKYELAEKDYSKTLARDSSFFKAYNNRGLIYLNQNRPDMALADFSTALAFDSGFSEAYFNRGLAYNILKNYEKSISDFNRYIQLVPNDADGYNNRALIYLNVLMTNQALADFTKAIALNPWVPDFWLNRAKAQRLLGKTEDAKHDELKAQQLRNRSGNS